MNILMRTIGKLLVALFLGVASMGAMSQAPANGGVQIVPAQPTSADNVFLQIPLNCGIEPLLGSGYRTSAVNGKIRVDLFFDRQGPCPAFPGPLPRLNIEIGRLPAGAYSIDVVQSRPVSFEVVFTPIATNMPLAVTDHRLTKTAPAVLVNYSDHWWDPSNPGAGLFIWQDARDQLLAAWFTYGADGKPAWYTIQAGTWTTATRYEGKLVQTNRLPNASLPPPTEPVGPSASQLVGTATLDFGGNDGAIAGVFTYKFDVAGAVARSHNIRRFNK